MEITEAVLDADLANTETAIQRLLERREYIQNLKSFLKREPDPQPQPDPPADNAGRAHTA